MKKKKSGKRIFAIVLLVVIGIGGFYFGYDIGRMDHDEERIRAELKKTTADSEISIRPVAKGGTGKTEIEILTECLEDAKDSLENLEKYNEQLQALDGKTPDTETVVLIQDLDDKNEKAYEVLKDLTENPAGYIAEKAAARGEGDEVWADDWAADIQVVKWLKENDGKRLLQRESGIYFKNPCISGKVVLYCMQLHKKSGRRVDESSLSFCQSYNQNRTDFWSLIKKGSCRLSKKEVYEQKTEEILNPIVEKHGFDLWDVEYVKEGGNWYLRAYIDKPGGIMVDDCEVVSRELSDILDEKDFIDEAYILEVSSPGLGRPLKKEKDFARSLGEEVEVRTYRAIDRQKEFIGILKDYDKDTVTIEYEDGETMTFDKADIALIRLAFDF